MRDAGAFFWVDRHHVEDRPATASPPNGPKISIGFKQVARSDHLARLVAAATPSVARAVSSTKHREPSDSAHAVRINPEVGRQIFGIEASSSSPHRISAGPDQVVLLVESDAICGTPTGVGPLTTRPGIGPLDRLQECLGELHPYVGPLNPELTIRQQTARNDSLF